MAGTTGSVGNCQSFRRRFQRLRPPFSSSKRYIGSGGSTMGSMGSNNPTADLEFSARDWFLPLAAMEVTPWRRRRSFGGGI
ncbi:hypothetical protein L3X38_003493 [Prunus dulcis]|uniref:Uncharacterized protein n=1 Tax=Prunus dulcis TaxID=3755 RepID=A0AAD4ZM47_PRUDU|nr:hypothetical protein L3X38_003493 [Prunus dulcis]